jgi:hypothetical protein
MTWQQQERQQRRRQQEEGEREIKRQVSEQPKLEHKQMKISEVFYQAHRRKIKQISGSSENGVDGFCAMGLLAHYHTKGLIDAKKDFKEWYSRYWIKYRDNVESDNDVNGITFKQFGDRFSYIGL